MITRKCPDTGKTTIVLTRAELYDLKVLVVASKWNGFSGCLTQQEASRVVAHVGGLTVHTRDYQQVKKDILAIPN